MTESWSIFKISEIATISGLSGVTCSTLIQFAMGAYTALDPFQSLEWSLSKGVEFSAPPIAGLACRSISS